MLTYAPGPILLFNIKYSTFLVNFNRILQRMHEDPLIEADYMNYDYLEAKSVPEEILDRYRSSKIQPGFISALEIIMGNTI